MKNEPKTLQEAIIYFSNPDNCQQFMIDLRWPDQKVRCPRCGSEKVTYLENARLWKCYEKHPKQKFSLKVGTIFEDSPLSLDKWLVAVWLVVNCKNGISSYEVGRDLGISQKSAWHLLHRVRFALHHGSFSKMMSGEVEADETYIGGKARNMHKDRRWRMTTGTEGKMAVMGLLERHPEKGKSRVRVSHVQNTSRADLQPIVRKHVEPGTEVYTDSHSGYQGLDEYFHEFVNHAETYARGKVHTNGLENFWSLLKRGLRGTYVSVEPFHLFRYLDEQAYRYNNRKDMNDYDRFALAMSQIVGKRLTWDVLTGKHLDAETNAF